MRLLSQLFGQAKIKMDINAMTIGYDSKFLFKAFKLKYPKI